MKRILLFILIMILFALPAAAQEKISMAVAANFIMPFKEITRLFTAKTGIAVDATYASTGQLYAQIVKGAPYDLFLSADEDKPGLLHREGRAEAPFVYGTGRVVVWTSRKDLCSKADWRAVVAMPGRGKMAIANPKTAPYGAAAAVALEKAGLMEIIRGRLVFAQNIAQAFQYASTGSVEAGFCALSAALSEEGRKGCSFTMDEAPPVIQSACLLKRTTHKDSAEKFIRFLSSEEAGVIKKRYGYY